MNAPAYTRFVNRALGRRLAALAGLLGVTPNFVTVLSAMASLSGVLLIALLASSPVVVFAGVLALLLGYALDSADGQLARLTGGGSVLGEWLDHVFDAIKVPGVHVAVLVSLYRFVSHDDSGLLLLPVLYTLVASVYFFTFILTDQLRRLNGDLRSASGRSGPRWSRSLVLLPTDFGVLCLSLLLLPWVSVFRTVYLGLLVLNLLFLLVALGRWSQEMAVVSRRAVPSEST